jgi:hypothetical protein
MLVQFFVCLNTRCRLRLLKMCFELFRKGKSFRAYSPYKLGLKHVFCVVRPPPKRTVNKMTLNTAPLQIRVKKCVLCVQTAAQADREQDDAEHGPQDAGR